MKDILVILIILLGMYVFIRLMSKEPILPWGKKKIINQPLENIKKEKKTKKSHEENEVDVFRNLFEDVLSFDNHMIRYQDNSFRLIAEVEPVNYYLLSQEEQNAIDAAVETYNAQTSYNVRTYLQNRFIDLTEPIEEIQRVMKEEMDDLHPMALEYGQSMVNDLIQWQKTTPRYETKRYLIFNYTVDVSAIKLIGDEDLEDRIIQKAFNELNRMFHTAKNQLRKADIIVQMLSSDGLTELSYYTFNRRKAMKNRYKDIERQEQLSLYVTADQTDEYIRLVKEEMQNAQVI